MAHVVPSFERFQIAISPLSGVSNPKEAATEEPLSPWERDRGKGTALRYDGSIGLADRQCGVLWQQEPLSDQAVRRCRDLGNIVRVCRIALCQRKTRIARCDALRLRAEERDISAGEVARIAFAEACLAHVPAGVCSHRHLDVHVAQA